MKSPSFHGCRPEESTVGRPRKSTGTAVLREGGDDVSDKHDEAKMAEVSQKINHMV